jgi:hypothetical protein
MAKHIDNSVGIDTNELIKVITPKNIDIISFVNDMAMRGKISSKYVVSSGIEDYHPNDYIYHQFQYNNSICNIFIKDSYDEALMGGGSAEDCPGTKKLVEYYKSSYDNTQLKVLNKSSMFIRVGGGIFSVIERNIAEFLVYLSWVKLNEVLRVIKARNPDVNVNLASSFELVERSDGVAFDIVRKLKESKDTSFFMLDGKTGNKIKMSVDSDIPEMKGGLTEAFYHDEFMKNLASYRAGTVDSITGAIKSADERIKRSMSVGVKTGLKLANQLVREGWVIESVNHVDSFVYPHKVYITSVFDGSKRYVMPEDCRDKLYLYDITVPIDQSLYGLSNSGLGVRARGFHPHRSSGSSNYYDDLAHVTELNKLCIGDLDGKPIEKIVNLIDALSGAYKPSMMGNAASRCVSVLYGASFGVMSSDAGKQSVKDTMEYVKPFEANRGIFNKPIVDKAATKKSKTDTDASDASGEPVMRAARSGSIFSVT